MSEVPLCWGIAVRIEGAGASQAEVGGCVRPPFHEVRPLGVAVGSDRSRQRWTVFFFFITLEPRVE